jgi:hypothetical protein
MNFYLVHFQEENKEKQGRLVDYLMALGAISLSQTSYILNLKVPYEEFVAHCQPYVQKNAVVTILEVTRMTDIQGTTSRAEICDDAFKVVA